MVLWIIFAALTGMVLTALLWPLMRSRSGGAARAAYDSTVYRDQLREIEADLERGMIGEAEAKAARTEISRRLLAAAEARGDGATGDTASTAGTPVVALVCVLLCVPVLGVALYLGQGSPALPDRPLASRLDTSPADQGIAALVARVEARLRLHPEDGAGWDVIAPVYLKHRRYRDAADAYGRAIRILGEDTRRLTGYGEALVLANNGIVSETARKAFERSLARDERQLKAHFWLAMAKEQDGRMAAAAAAWREMLKHGSKGARWRKVVEERLRLAESKAGDAGAAPEVAAKPAERAERGPSADDVKAAQQMTGKDRMAMITGMVEGLAERLREDGGDLKGWLRLIRSYMVLGRRADAEKALVGARKAFEGKSEALAQLDALATTLGL